MKVNIKEINDRFQNGEIEECEQCSSTGIVQEVDTCPVCNGLGFTEVIRD